MEPVSAFKLNLRVPGNTVLLYKPITREAARNGHLHQYDPEVLTALVRDPAVQWTVFHGDALVWNSQVLLPVIGIRRNNQTNAAAFTHASVNHPRSNYGVCIVNGSARRLHCRSKTNAAGNWRYRDLREGGETGIVHSHWFEILRVAVPAPPAETSEEEVDDDDSLDDEEDSDEDASDDEHTQLMKKLSALSLTKKRKALLTV